MNRLLAAVGPFAPFLVFVLAAAESAAFIGLVVPGELAVILGGVASGTGNVSLWLMIPAAVAGAVVGDSIGYRIGKQMGPGLLDRPRMARVGPHLDRAARLVGERGWWAIVVARFVSVLRVVVPFAAGMGRMPYRRFLVGNVVGGIAWGTTFTMVGYLAGANYPRMERWFRTGGVAVTILVVLVGAIVWSIRWAQRNRVTLRQAFDRFSGRRPVRMLLGALRRSPPVGFGLTAVAIVAGLWLFAGLVEDVLGSEEFFFFDQAAIRYLAANPVPELIAPAKVVNILSDPKVLGAIGALAAGLAVFTRRPRLAAGILLALSGAWAIVDAGEALVRRAPPPVTPLVSRMDYGFPSGQVALVTALAVVAAWPWQHPGWSATVRRFGIAALITSMVAASRVILLVEYPSDTITAGAVAASWALLVCLTVASRGTTGKIAATSS